MSKKLFVGLASGNILEFDIDGRNISIEGLRDKMMEDEMPVLVHEGYVFSKNNIEFFKIEVEENEE